jgi:hypothetical protein
MRWWILSFFTVRRRISFPGMLLLHGDSLLACRLEILFMYVRKQVKNRHLVSSYREKHAYSIHTYGFYVPWHNSPQWANASSFLRFAITFRHTTLGRIPLWTSDQPDGATSSWQHSIINIIQVSIPVVGFEPAVPASEWPQTHSLERPITVIGTCMNINNNRK